MNGLEIIQPGLRTTVQDLGRLGFQHHGLAQGGAADDHAFRWANKLLDNKAGDACLEILMGGFEAFCHRTAVVAITGADADIRINGVSVENWASHRLSPGDRIAVGRPFAGMLNYLAVRYGWQTPERFGSRSMVIRERLEGVKTLTKNTLLAIKPQPDTDVPAGRRVPQQHRRDYRDPLCLRLLPCYQHALFSQEDRWQLTHAVYNVGNRSDRMGYRLEGPSLDSGPGGIVSEGIALGSVQVPGDGQPIVLLQDRQTIGGYPKIGTLAAADCSRLAQKPPGSQIRFRFADLADIQSERMVWNRFFQATQWQSDGKTLLWNSPPVPN
ncbi:MAG: biotin-dependent carboxyltransferase [Oleiphilaceae bacterium]|nr:biotin-dependent carboxyltransferase [Oleiphilaceae bacterium]